MLSFYAETEMSFALKNLSRICIALTLVAVASIPALKVGAQFVSATGGSLQTSDRLLSLVPLAAILTFALTALSLALANARESHTTLRE